MARWLVGKLRGLIRLKVRQSSRHRALHLSSVRALHLSLAVGADRRRSTIIIAHRLSSIIDCQRILVLDGGVIAASGAHRELIRDCVPYQRLFQEQTE